LSAFRSGVEYLFGHECLRDDRIVVGSHQLIARAFPISVDVDALQIEATEARQSEAVQRTVDSVVARKLMMGVDRLDYSKGLIERFAAYRQFLETFPDNMGRITYIQIAPLSRTEVRAYAEIRNALEQAAGQTNGQYGDTDWTPIRYLNRNLPHASLMGLLRASHVGLVTPVRDGMNLVAKEYLAAQDEADPGVLILSNLAGAARELSSALLVNPYDARGVGMAIQTALTMPLGERRERHATMMATLRSNDIHHWNERFIAALVASGEQ
jgi:trehalose 6-phosphate synthase